MTKKFLTFGILAIVMVGLLVPTNTVFALQSNTITGCGGHADCVKCVEGGGAWADGSGFGEDAVVGDFCRGGTEGDKGSISNAAQEIAGSFVFKAFAKGIGAVLLKLSSWALGISGKIFDFVVKFSVIDMASNLDEEGLGSSVSQAWAQLRDIANMFFIFVLLVVAFKAMFSLSFGDVGKNVLNIIIVALVINFSLFFSKIVIDASNIVAIGFYNSIAYSNVSTTIGAGATTGDSGVNRTITSGYMRLLGLHSLYSPTVLSSANLLNGGTDAANMLVFGIMGSIFMLITAVIFLITGVMFVARFIILIFLMILSPIAFVAIIIPGRGGLFKTWMSALIDQSFFAPLFFALTWVVFKIAAGLQIGTTLLAANNADFAALLGTQPSDNSIKLLLNFVLLIGFAIMALVLSKQMASKTAGFTAITGGMTAGVAFAGRQTIGRGAKWFGDNLREPLSKSSVGRGLLWTANKGAGGSFDVKGIGESKLAKAVGGGELFKGLGSATGKGGFAKAIEKKAEAKVKYAKEVYGQTAEETEDARRKEVIYNSTKTSDEQRIKETRQRAVENAKETSADNEKRRRQYLEDKIKPNQEAVDKAKQEQAEKERKLEEEKKRSGGKSPQAFALEKEVEAAKAKVAQEENNLKEAEKRIENTDETYREMKEVAEGSKEEYQVALKNLNQEIKDSEYSPEVKKAREAWMGKKEAGKRRMQEFANRVERGSPVSTTVGALAGGALGTVFGGPLGVIGAVIGAGAGAGGGSWAGSKLGEKVKWTNWRGNTEAGRKIREAAEGKDKKDPKKAAKQFLKDMGVETDEEEGGEKGDKKEKEGGGEEKGKKDES